MEFLLTENLSHEAIISSWQNLQSLRGSESMQGQAQWFVLIPSDKMDWTFTLSLLHNQLYQESNPGKKLYFAYTL